MLGFRVAGSGDGAFLRFKVAVDGLLPRSKPRRRSFIGAGEIFAFFSGTAPPLLYGDRTEKFKIIIKFVKSY